MQMLLKKFVNVSKVFPIDTQGRWGNWETYELAANVVTGNVVGSSLTFLKMIIHRYNYKI
jgi:hypothetical protein